MKDPYTGPIDSHDFDMLTDDSQILLEPDDVTVSVIEIFACDNCGEDEVTHQVSIDFRKIGTKLELFQGCQTCCESYAQGIKESLGPRR